MTLEEKQGRHKSLSDFEKTTQIGSAVWREARWGGMRVGYETYGTDYDDAELLQGQPDGRCQCPHWGYLVSGQMTVRYRDHEQVVRAGELYYMAPGHTMAAEAGTVLIEFSPAEEFDRLMQGAQKSTQVQEMSNESKAGGK